jgi:hypothetical protein
MFITIAILPKGDSTNKTATINTAHIVYMDDEKLQLSTGRMLYIDRERNKAPIEMVIARAIIYQNNIK